jgi:hypothetical protein
MEAVAHNPSFAKKAGVPVSVGKHFHNADKGKKFKEGGVMKRKMKYADGGMLGSAPGMTPVGQSLAQPAPYQAQPSPYQAKGAMTPVGQSLAQPAPYQAQPSPYQAQPSPVRGDYFGGISPPPPPQRLPPAFSGQLQYGQGQGMAPPSPPAYSGASRDLSTIPQIGMPDYGMGGMTSGILHGQPQQALGGNYLGAPSSAGMSSGYAGSKANPTATTGIAGIKRGGQISRYAKGGKIVKKAEGGKMDDKMDKAATKFFAKKGEKKLAAHEKRESEGKEKDTKAIAKKEEKVLKSAPKALREYEHKEHKAMGFRKGGCTTKTMKRGGKTGLSMRKPNIGKALAAAQMLGAVAPPSAAAAPPAPNMGMPGMAGAPPSGMPGMKKGGNVIHHHHYAKGGSIGKGVERKGSTKVKTVKMASGGHVGSQPGRRGDGIAQKGHTRCKVC